MKAMRNVVMLACGIIIGVGISFSGSIYAAAVDLIGKINTTDKMIEVYKSEGNTLQIYAQPGSQSPIIKWEVDGKKSYIFYDKDDNTFSVTSNDANVTVDSGGRLNLFAKEGTYVTGWDNLKSNTTNKSLQQELDKKLNKNSTTSPAGSANGGIPIGTKLLTADGKVVIWNGIPNHTHNIENE